MKNIHAPVSVTGKWRSNTVLSDTPGVWWCLFFQMEWMIMMFSLKHAKTLGPGIDPGEPNHGASSETCKPCKTGYIGGLQGVPPLWMQNGSKTTRLNKGFNRRKFRSQTSDNMDRWKAEQGRGREKRKIRREKIREEKESEERRCRCAKR